MFYKYCRKPYYPHIALLIVEYIFIRQIYSNHCHYHYRLYNMTDVEEFYISLFCPLKTLCDNFANKYFSPTLQWNQKYSKCGK